MAVVIRRTQAERRAATRARLLDAAMECLVDLGYARTTTVEVARRAGVSRGAQLHHFPTRDDLVASAVEHVFARRLDEFRALFGALPDSEDRVMAAIDLLWSMVDSPTFTAWLELVVAARTDPALGAHVRRVTAQFRDDVAQTFAELFPPPAGGGGVLYNIGPAFAFALMEGLALERLSPDDTTDERTGAVLSAFKLLTRLLPPET
jgi:AcrR family transcriptional regulator